MNDAPRICVLGVDMDRGPTITMNGGSFDAYHDFINWIRVGRGDEAITDWASGVFDFPIRDSA